MDSVTDFAKEGHFGPELSQLMLNLGKEFTRNDSLLPESLTSLTAPKKQCFKTAAEIALADTSLVYTEGYAFANIPLRFPIAHAWLTTKDGLVVDPTWEEGEGYFGLTFSARTLSRYLVLSKEYGILQSLWHQEKMREQFLKDRGLTAWAGIAKE